MGGCLSTTGGKFEEPTGFVVPGIQYQTTELSVDVNSEQVLPSAETFCCEFVYLTNFTGATGLAPHGNREHFTRLCCTHVASCFVRRIVLANDPTCIVIKANGTVRDLDALRVAVQPPSQSPIQWTVLERTRWNITPWTHGCPNLGH